MNKIPAEVSAAISWLRFPLMFGVVLIHSGISAGEGYPTLDFIVRLFTQSLPAFCVPMFMAISGYLFFAKTTTLTPRVYLDKLRSRGRSLLVPYIFWNAIVIGCFWAMHRFTPSLINPNFENVANYPPPQLLRCFYDGSGGQPIAFQFWFIRNLMLLVVASPLIYILFRRTFIGIALFSVLYLLDSVSGLWTAYFFALGAWAALQKPDFMSFARRYRRIALIGAAAALCAMMAGQIPGARQIYILCMITASLGFAPLLVSTVRIPERLSQASFFLFCVHALPLMLLAKTASIVLAGRPEWLWIATYFFNPVFISAAAIGLYALLKTTAPRLTSLITGGR